MTHAAEATTGLDLGILAQYGILGLFAALLLLFAKTSYKREIDRADRLEAEVNRLNNMVVERVIPALTTATSAVETATDMLRDHQRHREDELRRATGGR